MRPAALEGLRTLSKDQEGVLPYFYLDKYGLVTAGTGNLADTAKRDESPNGVNPGNVPEDVFGWGWQVNGRPANRDEIQASYDAVKARGDLKRSGGVVYGNVPGNIVRLPPEAINDLFDRTLASTEATLRRRFSGYDAWPADAQVGAVRMVWAMGGNFNFPKFQAYANEALPNFRGMAAESHIRDNEPLSAALNQLFLNSARIIETGGDPDTLLFFSGVQQVGRALDTVESVQTAGRFGLLGLAATGAVIYGGLQVAKAKGWVK